LTQGKKPLDEVIKKQQVWDHLKKLLKDGHYPKGSFLPSVEELAADRDFPAEMIEQIRERLITDGFAYTEDGTSLYSTGKSGEEPTSPLIGVLLPAMVFTIYPHIIRGIDDVARTYNYRLLVGNSAGDPEREQEILAKFMEQNIHGLIIEPCRSSQIEPGSQLSHFIRNLSIPTVVIDNYIPELDVSCVALDDEYGGFQATDYLIRKGHRRIAYVYKREIRAAVDRLQGYRNALSASGIPASDDLVYSYCEDEEPSLIGYQIGKRIAALSRNRPTAVFFFNDEIAVQSYSAFREAGLSIPGDISIIGFDNTSTSGIVDVPLTTMDHPKYFLGKWSADVVFDGIANRSRFFPRKLLIRPALVERDSVSSIEP